MDEDYVRLQPRCYSAFVTSFADSVVDRRAERWYEDHLTVNLDWRLVKDNPLRRANLRLLEDFYRSHPYKSPFG